VLAYLGRGQPGAGLTGEASKQPRLAARPGAHVEPPPAIAGRAAGADQRERRQLAGLVLHAGPARLDQRKPCGISLGQIRAER
jgi:hypothetical protein